MLPGTGRGGYATSGGWLWISKYTLRGPIPLVVVVIGPGGGLNREGMLAFRGGRDGLSGTDLSLKFSGTSTIRVTLDIMI